MTEAAKETREGIIFTCRIDRSPPDGGPPVFKFYLVDDDQRAIAAVTHDRWFGNTTQKVDAAFQHWLKHGPLPMGAERDIPPEVLEILFLGRKERLEGVDPYKRTHRFLEAADHSYSNQRFIFTTDKSDVPPLW